MQISTRSRYAVMAMVHLACRQSICLRPVALGEIAASQHLSLPYLEQLFARLRRARLVVSARGPGGGYRLARAAELVTIADIVQAVEETLCCDPDATASANPTHDGPQRVCATHALWQELAVQIQLFLAGITLADVVQNRVAGRACQVLMAKQVAE